VQLDVYRPHENWFAHSAHSIHGLGHVARVLVWADILACALLARGEVVDVEAVRWAAALHDVGRHDDGRDPHHGERSASWVEANHALLPVPLDPQRLARVSHCCRWHVTPDCGIPELTPELTCLKDADGLDRVRIFDLNPRFLRLREAKELVDSAWALFGATCPSDKADPWRQVREAAVARHFWR
jgi:hypothetical protein